MSDILGNYSEFVEAVTSEDSNDSGSWLERISNLKNELDVSGINLPLLVTGAVGMAAEGGEFLDIVKKVLFHGKSIDVETEKKLLLELGDVAWYWINTCRALNLDPGKVLAANVAKLESRYPGGKFDIYHSENRKASDV